MGDEDVGGFDGVGDRAVEANASHRRHHISGVPGQQ
jgi:hypothetical protein